MGYTHYWRRVPKFDSNSFKLVVRDLNKAVKAMEGIVDLADGCGEGKPIINNEKIVFNGREKCGHPQRNLGIAWPSSNAKGVSFVHKSGKTSKENTIITTLTGHQEELATGDSDTGGTWYAGLQLNQRTCGGHCSHETFLFPQEWKDIPKYNEPEGGKYFECTKTAYKPYDILVNIALIIADHYLGDDIDISSDGTLEQWEDAMEICQRLFGYGKDFQLKEE